MSLKSRDWKIEIVWPPGHSEVMSNDVAERLAKVAAGEAKELGEETRVVTVQYIKRLSKTNIKRKWQQRLPIGEFGRDYPRQHDNVGPTLAMGYIVG